MRIIEVIKRLIPAGVLLALAGCGWLPNHHLDYREANSIAPMKVPDGMPFIGEQALYPVPDGPARPDYPDGNRDQIPKPPKLAIANSEPDSGDEPAPDLADPSKTRVVMARDGSGYPIIMIHTPYNWAWEYVGQALGTTDLKIDDRDRDSGTYYIKTPKKLDIDGNEALIKLSHTANGIQVAVMDRKGKALLDKGPGTRIIQQLYDAL